MAENKIVINGDEYTDTEIMSGNAFLSNSLACDELTIDTLDASVNNSRLLGTLFKPKNADGLLTDDGDLLWVMPKIRVKVTDPDAYEYGTPSYYYHDNKLVGKFYVSDVERTGKDVYMVSCVSAIGLLDTTTHYGGMYTGQTMAVVLSDIIGNVVTYSVSSAISGQPIYGHLPIDTRRSNLHQLLFAMGASVFKSASGDMYIAPLGTDSPEELDTDRIYLEGSVSQDKKIKRAIITEHSYNAYDSDQETILYEGLVSAETIITPKGLTKQGAIIRFDGPMHDLTIEGGTIIESNVNYAVIGPSPACKLIGKAYTHTTRQIVRENTNARSVSVQLQDNDAVVANATLVSFVNSSNVADRVMSYYSTGKKVRAGIVKQVNDKPGMRVAFDDTFGEPVTGYVKSMDITLSGKLKADSEVVVGYTPTAAGNNYSKVAVLTSTSWIDWEVPNGVYKILLALIGGGDGGESGAKGEDGLQGVVGQYEAIGGTGGKGGKAGKEGVGGKVLVQEISVIPGQIFSFKAGVGGSGGKYTSGTGGNVPGSKGTASQFGTYSSENGERSALGYSELFNKKIYALPGKPGHNGGRGRDGGDESALEALEPDYFAYPGQTGSSYYIGSQYGQGGGGGGAAYWPGRPAPLGNGSNGQNAYGETRVACGEGGAGANGGETFIYVYGQESSWNLVNVPEGAGYGGCGGNGGGGGGGGGGGAKNQSDRYPIPGDGGLGGNGSDGGDGVSGCAIIYY